MGVQGEGGIGTRGFLEGPKALYKTPWAEHPLSKTPQNVAPGTNGTGNAVKLPQHKIMQHSASHGA